MMGVRPTVVHGAGLMWCFPYGFENEGTSPYRQAGWNYRLRSQHFWCQVDELRNGLGPNDATWANENFA